MQRCLFKIRAIKLVIFLAFVIASVWFYTSDVKGQQYSPFSLDQTNSEILIAQYTDGIYAVTSQNEYSGIVTLTVSGIGQASGTSYTDAFYLISDYSGNPTIPTYPAGWVLTINGQLAKDLIPNQQIPSYKSDHTYTFEINAPGERLIFGVSDTYTVDNSGRYIIEINAQSRGQVPYFSQIDPRWATHPLRTDVNSQTRCSTYCSTIGRCGCTLTSGAMVFAYYGADLTPPILSDCMGIYACPFSYSTAAACTSGKASYVNRYTFSWGLLERELNTNQRPVILGMHRLVNDTTYTHWVVVTSGQGNDASGYIIHDPGVLNGANTSLSVYTRQNYILDWIVVYSGTPSSGSSVEEMEYRPDLLVETIDPRNPDDNPTVNSIVDNWFNLGTDDISGEVQIYHIYETALVVQLSATSNAGDVTEMKIWTASTLFPGFHGNQTIGLM
jgi:hypothetical protein